MTVKIGAVTAWQYILEDTLKNPTSSGVQWRLPGIVSGGTPMTLKFNPVEIRTLNAPGAADGRAIASVQAQKNEYEWSATYVPVKRVSAPQYHILHFVGLAMNTSSGTAAGGGWTFGTATTTNLRSFTARKTVDNMEHMLQGCQVNRVTVRGRLDAPIEIEASGPGTTSTFSTITRTNATSLRDATPFMFSDVTIYIDGAQATFCTAFEFSVNNAAQPIWSLGNKEPQQVIAPTRTVDVGITRQYQDNAQYADAKNNVAKSITVRFSDTVNVDFKFRGCKPAEHNLPPSPPEEGVLVHELRYTARDFSAAG